MRKRPDYFDLLFLLCAAVFIAVVSAVIATLIFTGCGQRTVYRAPDPVPRKAIVPDYEMVACESVETQFGHVNICLHPEGYYKCHGDIELEVGE